MPLTHSVLAFFGLTFLISGAAAAPLIALLHGLLPDAVPPFFGLVAAVDPGIAALVITIREMVGQEPGVSLAQPCGGGSGSQGIWSLFAADPMAFARQPSRSLWEVGAPLRAMFLMPSTGSRLAADRRGNRDGAP